MTSYQIKALRRAAAELDATTRILANTEMRDDEFPRLAGTLEGQAGSLASLVLSYLGDDDE